jgi:rRNA processing protein Krr1/Pno1
VEILDDFEEYLRKKKNNLNGYPDEFSKIQKVVRDIISYEMMTYDPGEDANTRFSVNFKFFEEIAKIFEEPGAKEIFDDIYNSVPNEKNDLIKEAELEKIIARVVGKTGRTVRSAFKTYFEKYYYKLADFDKVVLENACPNGMKINSESDVYELLKKITNGLRAKESDLQVKAIDKKPSVKIETKASNKQVKVNREKKSKIAVPKVKVLKKTKKK